MQEAAKVVEALLLPFLETPQNAHAFTSCLPFYILRWVIKDLC